MSKIYDALIKAGEKRRRLGTGLFGTQPEDEARLLPRGWQEFRAEWKTIGIVAGLILVFGLVAVVNQVRQALRNQIDKRALVIATNLSDAAAGHVLGKNVLELHALVTKYARLDGTAYALIEDANGQIIAQSLRAFPAELRATLTMDERKQVETRTVSFQGKRVYETRTPILEGQVGVAHVGIWGQNAEAEIYHALVPIVALLVIVFFAGGILCVVFARAMTQSGKRMVERTVETGGARAESR